MAKRKPTRGAGGVLMRGKEVLLVIEQESNDQYGKKEGMFSIPLGTINEGETAEQAVRREFLEETGTEVVIKYRIATVRCPRGIANLFLLKLRGKTEAPHELCTLWMEAEKLLRLPDNLVRPPTKAAVQTALDWISLSSNNGP